jgi:hypothetical protein
MSRRRRPDRRPARTPTAALAAERVVAGPPAAPARSGPPRGLLFGALVAVALAVAVGSVGWAMLRGQAALRNAPPAPASVAIGTAQSDAIRAEPRVIFRGTAMGDAYGKIALAPLKQLDGPRAVAPLVCERVYVAAGQGLCLMADRGIFTTYSAAVFGPDFEPRRTLPLAGIPSRTRVSPDGRYGAMTVFVSGHSYAGGDFSTQTSLIDMPTGAVLVNSLEEFEFRRDGGTIKAPDFNVWGVTFARDSNRFYATLATGGKTFLVRGDIAARRAEVVHEGVECPSLSPDNTRIAFKKRVTLNGRSLWQPAILDLATLKETALAETRGIDDQIEWLDDGQILYALPDETSEAIANIWALPADGGAPRLLLPQAESPAVVR